MRMEIGLSQRPELRQILSPQMIQSMEILVLNSQQLEEKIAEELEENVALEIEEPRDESPDEADGAASTDGAAAPEGAASAPAADAAADTTAAGDGGAGLGEMDLLRDRYEHLAEYQAEEYYTSPGPGSGVRGQEDDDKLEVLQNTPDRPVTLQEHLIQQIRLRSDLDDRQRELCHEFIYNLDARGYLLYPIEEILDALNHPVTNASAEANGSQASAPLPGELMFVAPIALPVELPELERALAVVRSLEPAGVGARDLAGCLLLQLDRDPGEYPLERKLIEEHLADIARNRLPQIAKAVGRSIDDVKDAIDIIATLDPIPGKSFATPENSYVRPDVLIQEQDGDYRVQVENEALPRLRISPYYRKLLELSQKDPEIRSYIRKKIDNAEFLMNAIQQRRSTLMRVAEEVVKTQQDFFRRGPRYLKPLKMQQVADAIGVNVSTVSRAISGKYFQAPNCIRELKYLFTGGTLRDDGIVEARGSVIHRLRDLIAGEDKRHPLSDSRLVALLAREGINISRRTVTKYREAESIPSSRERKTF